MDSWSSLRLELGRNERVEERMRLRHVLILFKYIFQAINIIMEIHLFIGMVFFGGTRARVLLLFFLTSFFQFVLIFRSSSFIFFSLGFLNMLKWVVKYFFLISLYILFLLRAFTFIIDIE